MIHVAENKERFLRICRDFIKREGIEDLISYLEKSDFFTAPASTRFHGAYEGGLCEHSLNVFDAMMGLTQHSAIGDDFEVNGESAAIVSLFHDLCKVNMYKQDTRNVKKDGVWVTVPTYTINEKFVYGGHGSKSVFIVSQFIKLKPEEAVAINCHMGSWDGNKDVGGAYEHYPIAWFLHVADEAATFLIESKEGE